MCSLSIFNSFIKANTKHTPIRWICELRSAEPSHVPGSLRATVADMRSDRAAPRSGAETSNRDQGSCSVDWLIVLREHKLDAGCFKNFPAPSVRSHFNYGH